MRTVRLFNLSCSLVLLAVAHVAQAQANFVIDGKKLESAPTIDGVLSDGEWSSAATFNGTIDEDTISKNEDPSEFWIAYDEKYIYFAARLHDKSPNSIKANEYRTNVGLGGDDQVVLQLDPNGTLEVFSEFAMNAAGGSNLSIAGGRAIKREWMGDFITKGRITEKGWEVEARIPWALMQLPSAGNRNPRINVMRYTSRTQRTSLWAFTNGAGIKYGTWSSVQIPKMPFERKLKLLPYAFGGFEEGGDVLSDVGLDFKTSLTETVELVGTINPDFRNIEGDILSLDFSYLERLPNDTRPFFQEGADYIGSALFAPQRISKFDAGLNLYGRINDKVTFGALHTQDFGNESASVATGTYNIDSRHIVRVAATSLQGDLRPDNDAYLLRFVERFADFGYGLRYMESHDETDGTGRSFDIDTGYKKGPFEMGVQYTDIDERFRPRLGFLPERDLRGYRFGGQYTQVVKSGALMEYEISGELMDFEHQDGSFYRNQQALFGSLTFRDGTDFDFGYQKAGFEENRDHFWYFSLEKPRGDSRRRWQVDYLTGKVAGEDYDQTTIGVFYRPMKNFQVALRHEIVNHFEHMEQSIVSGNYDLGNDQSISGRLVRRDDDWSGYLSWRKSGNRGAEYYVIVGDPNSEKFRGSLILKVVMPFELRI